MQIILVHPRLRQARTLTITRRWVLVAALLLLFFVSGGSGLLSWAVVRYALPLEIPLVHDWLREAASRDAQHRDAFVRQNLEALAARVGQLQAQMTRLDAIGERVATQSGVSAESLQSRDGVAVRAGRGGPLLDATPAPLSLTALSADVERIAREIDARADLFGALEAELLGRVVARQLLPTDQPLPDGFLGSRFGWRTDPFTGRPALHEGIDFNAPVGTPIVAAAAGIVAFAGWAPAYGLVVDIDHGQGLVTRYAHASKVHVRERELVRQGQRIADVGSTGRSSGPHLHFEVRVDGEARDPLAWLQADGRLAGAASRPAAQAASGANGRAETVRR